MKGFLTTEQKSELLRELRLERVRKYADRIRVILLLDQGKTYESIALYLFLDEGTIANYRKRYVEGGLEGLIIDDYAVKKWALTEDQLLLLSVELDSKIYLSTKDICAYIKREFGVEYTMSGLTKLLHRIGLSYKKPKAVPGKANKEKQELFIEKYNKLKNKGKIYFSDSTHPYHNPVISYGWIRKGMEFEILSNSGRFHLNINGALCLDNLDIITRTCETVNADSICELLIAIKNKNLNEKVIYLFLDNASFNRSKKVSELAKKLNINLEYLPPYSPNLNPIERLWNFFKKKVLYNKYFEKREEFANACTHFFRYIRGC